MDSDTPSPVGPPRRAALLAALLPLAIGCEVVPPEPEILFTDVTAAAGIVAHHRLPPAGLTNIVDSNGGGAAFVDLDGDGWLDLLFAAGPRSPDPGADPSRHGGLRAFRSLGQGRFEDATARWGLPPRGSGVAWAAADIDGDGDRDLYLVDDGPNRLFENTGEGVLRDISSTAGVADPGCGVGAVFLDIDADHDLDLYVANYVEFDPRRPAQFRAGAYPGPLAWPAQRDRLYRNRGDGSFEDVTGPSGIGAFAGRAMSVTAADLDSDTDPDLYVLNDATPSFVFLNDGAGRFVEAGRRVGLALGAGGRASAAMAIGFGDLDGDGHLDVSVSDDQAASIFTRVAPGRYRDRAGESGMIELTRDCVGWSHNLLDVDRDGDLDIFTVTGGLTSPLPQPDLLALNSGKGVFTNAAPRAGPYFTTSRTGRCSVAGDYDNDGDQDLFITTLHDTPVLLRNDSPGNPGWITLDLVGRRNRDAFGARVIVEAGGRRQVAEARCPTTFLGQDDPRLHFGLGPGVERVDRLIIVWPDGTREERRDLVARRIVVVRKGE